MTRVHYVVEAIDVDGDGIPDGDLVKKFDGNKLISQKFVAKKELKKLATKVKKANSNALKTAVKSPKQRVIYKTPPQTGNQPVVVQQQTNFGEYLKMGVGVGAGAEVGKIAVDAMFDGLSDLF